MAKLENSTKNMVLSLTAITLVVGALLGLVNAVTAEPIEQAKANKQAAAIAAVVPGEGNEISEPETVTSANGEEAVIFTVTKGGQPVGKAVRAVSKNGFGGKITVMFGFDPNGNILGYSVLDCSNETPGLGAKMPDWFQKGQKGDIIGKNPSTNNMTVSKDGGEVDAITAATISSRAFLDALAQAYGVCSGTEVATTSASQQQNATAVASCENSQSCADCAESM
ncbi:MAG: RnfABCDGE type electron transport complex subunit G [Bacteroidales bacterium]|nr:RnfABCDGE type electron transport complex subunit G [Bacteroidales bacterium]